MVKSIVEKLEDKFGAMSSKMYGLEYEFLEMKLFFINKKVKVEIR